jgi:pyridoxal phosphate enzyme (YggS family)
MATKFGLNGYFFNNLLTNKIDGGHTNMSMTITVEALRKRIEKSRKNSVLSSGQVTFLGACKGQVVSSIIGAIEAGVTNFGENRVQEAEAKWPEIKTRFPKVHLHLIGPLQTNKVKEALKLFDVIQTIDRPKLALAIAKEIEKSRSLEVENKKHFSTSRLPDFPTSFYIQVNTGKEPQKGGVIPEEADALIEYCLSELKLPVVGLMCIPPVGQLPAPHFALLRQIAQKHGLKELSMGMSDDFETAVRMGSTCVRVGRALFGERSASG